MLTDDELPPLPSESYVGEDGLWEQRVVLTEDSVREYARAVEQAAYEKAAQECEALIDEAEERRAEQHSRELDGTEDELSALKHWQGVRLFNTGARNSAAAIRALAQGGKNDA